LNRAVFLDRDGVVNRGVMQDGRPFAPTDASELQLMPGVTDALARLSAAGFLLIVATNQPDVARGRATRAGIDGIHEWMRRHLPLTAIRVCFHDDADLCACRKPKPGLLIAAAVDYEIQLERSFMIGDRWRDVEAGQRAGCATIFIDRGYHERRPDSPDAIVSSLPDAADWILNHIRSTC
jgi:D-glycero-D-manno-heptose 1,7-bisphosphate phosphatase